jgi:hypothetical protein
MQIMRNERVHSQQISETRQSEVPKQCAVAASNI